MDGKKILVIDDDTLIQDIARRAFEQAGAEVYMAASGQEGLRQLFNHRPHLIILDIMMPDMDGWETCRQIRLLSDVPIIMLTSLSNEEAVIKGLDSGADDFMSKPFGSGVLLSRSRAVLRRVTAPPSLERPVRYQDDYLGIDLEKRKVFVRGDLVKLTPTEYKLLEYLVSNAGRVLTFHQILENVWGWEYRDSIDYVHVYVSHLRKKVEEDPKNSRYFLTEHGVGYRFEKLDPASR